MNATGGRDEYGVYVDRVAQGAGLSSFGQGVGRALGYATQIALARMYGSERLGFYVLGVTVVGALNMLAQFGMDNGVVRYVAHYRAERDTPRVRGVVLLALCIALGLSLIFALGMFVGSGWMANKIFDESDLEIVFQAFSVSVPFFAMMTMALWATQGFQTVRYQTLVQEVFRPFVNIVLIGVFYLLSAQILGAIIAYAISMAAGAFLAVFYLKRLFPPLLDNTIAAKLEPRRLFNVAGPMNVANLAQYVESWTAVTVLGIFATASEVGIYNTAARTAALSALALLAFRNIFSPIVSHLYGNGSFDELNLLYRDVSKWVFAGSVASFLLIVILAKDIMSVFGSDFISGWNILIIVAVAQLITSSAGPTARILAMTDHQKAVMLITLSSALAGVIVNVLLVPTYGMLGAAVALVITSSLASSALVGFVRHSLGLWPYGYLYWKPLAAGILSAGGVYVVKWSFSLPTGILPIIIFSPLFMGLFAMLLLALGLSASDKRLLGSLWTALKRGAGRGPSPEVQS